MGNRGDITVSGDERVIEGISLYQADESVVEGILVYHVTKW